MMSAGAVLRPRTLTIAHSVQQILHKGQGYRRWRQLKYESLIMRMFNHSVRQLLQHATRRRYLSSPSSKNNNDSYKQGMKKLKEKHPFLYKMAPSRGGTEAPDAKFLAIFAVVGAAGFYSWFIDPPSKQQEES